MADSLTEVIKALQAFQSNQKAVLDIGEAKDKAQAELKATQDKLDQVKHELQSGTAGLNDAQIANKRQLDVDLNNGQQQLTQLQKRIKESSDKLADLEAKVRDKEGQYNNVIAGLNALRDRIEGRAA